jgi:hypothetical protein
MREDMQGFSLVQTNRSEHIKQRLIATADSRNKKAAVYLLGFRTAAFCLTKL